MKPSISVTAGVYDGGWISHVGSASDSDVPAGNTWRCYFSLARIDYTVSEPGEEVDLVVSSST